MNPAELSQPAEAMSAIGALQSKDHRDLLDTIDKLRSQGINKYIDLPQIFVCGDQSAGKSSVLEAVSGLSFPTKDALCTSFATELILRRDTFKSIKVRIIPSDDRSEDQKKKLRGASWGCVEKAKEVMGISEGTAFSTDILRIEVSGPVQPHLTIVDLPGLFLAGNKDQSATDAYLVKNLVLGYMKKPRSVILAVVSAKSDFALQQVTEYTRDVDRNGLRTLGIITKPDTLDRGSDSERFFVELAENKDVVFRLGWHVLRNRDYSMRKATTKERDEREAAFFSTGVWTVLKPSQLGVAALRIRLSTVLREQIVKQLPNVLHDVEDGITQSKATLEKLGDARLTIHEQKLYLLKISEKFTALVKDAVEGTYTSQFFHDVDSPGGYEKRLRVVVQNTLQTFEEEMREKGEAMVITEEAAPPLVDRRSVSRAAYLEHVKILVKNSRGRELPGTFNPLIVAELFSEQCKPWTNIVQSLASRLYDSAETTIKLVLAHVSDDQTAEAIFRMIIGPSMEDLQQEVEKKVRDILEPHISGHPITYDQQLTDLFQKAQAARRRAELQEALKTCFGVFPLDASGSIAYSKRTVNAVMESLATMIEPDMEQYSCLMATDMMEAYYKVARKMVVDNVAQLAIEECSIKKLPELLAPGTIFGIDDATVQRLAEESIEVAGDRAQAEQQLRVLKVGLVELGRLRKLCPI